MEVCPNVIFMAKERIAQSKRARAGLFVIINYYSHKWSELVSSRRFLSCLPMPFCISLALRFLFKEKYERI